jgi:phage-related protein
VVSDHAGDTFRVVYTVRWPACVYVLHVFQKKSKSGISTPKAELNLVDSRLKRLQELHDNAVKNEKGKRND